MKQNKYIVLKEDGRWGLALGFVEYHRELATTEELAHGMVKGGGMFKIDHDEKQIIFYGKSDDFGYPNDIDIALASCYHQVKDEIADLEFCRTHEECDLHDYTMWYQDELGNNVEVTPVRQATQMDINTYGMLPNGLSTYYPPMAKGKNSKNQVAKNAKKKAKAKRRAQKQARKHK